MSHRLGATARIAVVVCLVVASGLHADGRQASPRGKSQTSPLRQNAVVLLDSTIDELDEVENVETRLTFAGDIVRLLATIRPERCRRMLDSLFDDLSKLKGAEVARTDSRAPNPDALFRKLIQVAASLDRKLARTYIDRYAEQSLTQKAEPNTSAQTASLQADMNMMLALQLIETDPALAVTVAERSVRAGVTTRTLEFLGALKRKDNNVAGAFFATALQSVNARQGNDVNELLLLYAYVFSPKRVLWLTPQGLVQRQIPGYQQAAQDYPVDARLAEQFLRVSTEILLKGTQHRLTNIHLTNGASGDLYFINLIKPLAAAYAPSLFNPLSEQGNLLVSYLQPEQHSRLQSDMERVNGTQNRRAEGVEKDGSALESLLSRADELPPSAKRDQLYYNAAMSAVHDKQYDLAAEIVERVSSESREKVRGFVEFSIAQKSVSERQLERAERWVLRDDDLARRAYVFTLMANSLLDDGGKDYSRADKFLNEADRLASKLDNSREAISVLLKEAEVYSRFDNPRASETLRLALKAANKNEGFTGDGKVNRRLEIGGFSFFYEMYDDRLSSDSNRQSPRVERFLWDSINNSGATKPRPPAACGDRAVRRNTGG